jgi:hypothetical protein
MAGRIVRGRPGPARCPSIFDGRPNAATWKPVPEAAQQAFGSVETVMKEKIVRRP